MMSDQSPLWTPPGDEDPDAIDISLNLIGQGGIDAINSLTRAMERLESFQREIGSGSTIANSAYNRQHAGARPPERTQAAQGDNVSRPPGVQWVGQGPTPFAFRTGPMTGEGQGQLFNPEINISRPPSSPVSSSYQFRTRAGISSPFERAAAAEAQARMPDMDLRLASQISDNASRPPARFDRTLQMASHLAPHLPNHISAPLQVAGRAALLSNVASMGGGSNFLSSMMGSVAAQSVGSGGAGGNQPSGQSGIFQIAKTAAYTGAGLNLIAQHLGSNFQAPGVALGYDRGPQLNIPGTQIGMQLPSFGRDSAFRQELDRRMNAFRLRLQGGINGRQAGEIMNTLAGAGFSGQEGENVAFDVVAPLVRQGQDPRLAGSMVAHAIRNSNTNLQDVKVTLDNLGDSARTARMTLSEYQEALDQTASVMQNLGAFRNQGVELTRQLTDSTGLTPQQITPIAQSGLFQAMAFQNNGVMPNAVGSMSGSMFAGDIQRTVNFAMRAAAPFGNRIGPDGRRLSAEEARQNQMIQAANFAGMPLETFAKLQRNAGRLPGLANLRGSLSDFAKQIQNAGTIRDRINNDPIKRVLAGPKGGAMPDPNAMRVRDRAMGALDDTLDGASWKPVHHALLAAAPGQAGVHTKERDDYFRRIRDIEGMRNPSDRLRATQKLLRDQAQEAVPDSRPEVKLDLTPWARKLVQQAEAKGDASKTTARRGGPPVNTSRNQPDPFGP